LDELQAAILRVKLPFLSEDNKRRREIGARYFDVIDHIDIAPPHRYCSTMSN